MRVDPWGLEYGALRDFVGDYYQAFGGHTSIEQGEFAGKKCAIVTLGAYQQRFFYDGTVLVEHRNEDGSLSGLEFVKIANNVEGHLYLQRSAFIIAMGMTEDGTAKVTVSDEFYVGDMLSMLDFATNISDAVNSGSDMKDFSDFFTKAPVLGQYIQIGATLNELYRQLRNGEILSTGYYRAESVVVQSPEFGWYSYEVNTLYGTRPGTSYYQWAIKSAYAWGVLPGGE